MRVPALAVAVVVAAAVAVPAAFGDRSEDPAPSTPEPVASAVRPVGRIPLDVTGVSACRAGDCRTVADAAQVRLLVDGLNANEPYPFDDLGPCDRDPVGVTLVFSGPDGPYPVVEAMTERGWWVIEGEPGRNALPYRDREDVLQAQRFGVVVHDCGVTYPRLEPDQLAYDFVGLTLLDAQSLATGRGATVRVLGQDDDCVDAVTADLQGLRRVNVYLENGRVKSASYF